MEWVVTHQSSDPQVAARVDLEHPMNDIKRFPASSYRPVEVSLARLNALSGLDLPAQVFWRKPPFRSWEIIVYRYGIVSPGRATLSAFWLLTVLFNYLC